MGAIRMHETYPSSSMLDGSTFYVRRIVRGFWPRYAGRIPAGAEWIMNEPGKRSVILGKSANERLKDLWESRVGWSTVGAVALHATLFGWAGFQIVQPLVVEPQPSSGQLVIVQTSLARGSGLEGMARPPARPVETPAEADPPASAGLEGTEVGGAGDDEVMDLWAAASARLGYSGLYRAEVVEAEEKSAPEEAGQDSLSIDGVDAEDLLADLAYGDSLDLDLDLDRLTEIRPELAVLIPSMWILLRNPTAVETFLRRSYGRWSLDRSEPGSVTVTVWIDTRGSVEWAEVSRSSGRNNLDEAALALFNEVVAFRPARQDGVSVSGSATFALLFPW
jgi:TonB family protein